MTVHPDHPWVTEDNDGLMRKLGGYRRDRESGEEGFTLAGLLMFGKFEAIKDPACAPNFFPDYKEITSDSDRWSDRIYPDGTWEVNLFQFYRRVLPKLQASLPTPFRLEDGVRRDGTLAHEALVKLWPICVCMRTTARRLHFWSPNIQIRSSCPILAYYSFPANSSLEAGRVSVGIHRSSRCL